MLLFLLFDVDVAIAAVAVLAAVLAAIIYIDAILIGSDIEANIRK